MTPFEIEASREIREDLAIRLNATILPEQSPGPEWANGTPPRVVGEFVDYWRNDYDWDATAERLNRYEHLHVNLDGCQVHVLRKRARASGRLPVILTHGWPVTFNEMLPTVEALDGELDVIVPSLPGYAFSGVLPIPFREEAIAARWHKLMTEVLGYDRFLTYGEDVGAGISDWLAGKYPESVAGIIASHASLSARDRDGVELSDEERAFFASLDKQSESGYAHQQATRPDTLAVALTDSPAGLLSWLVEKYAAWGPGNRLEPYHPDEIITPVMLYWMTRSIGTSFRAYSESGSGGQHPIITVPASLIIQQHEAGYLRTLGEKSHRDIRAFEVLDRGGHFPAWKAPADIARAILALEEAVNT